MPRVTKAIKVFREHRVFKASRVCKELKEFKVHKVFKVK